VGGLLRQRACLPIGALGPALARRPGETKQLDSRLWRPRQGAGGEVWPTLMGRPIFPATRRVHSEGNGSDTCDHAGHRGQRVMLRRVAITGAHGQLGQQLVTAFREAGDEVLPLARPDFDLSRRGDLARVSAWSPDVVINSAAWTDVDGCARDPARAMAINGIAAGEVANAAARAGALTVQISTNEVFDGSLDGPYTENDTPNPVNPYGASKLLGERLVAEATRRHLIVRTAWLFGAEGSNFVTKILAAADRASAAHVPLRVVGDEWGNPTSTSWLAAAVRGLADAALDDAEVHGIWHRAGQPATSRVAWARRILHGTDAQIVEISLDEYPRASRVPPRATLVTARPLALPAGDWQLETDAAVTLLRAAGHGSTS
jgi:dTDP-4-dehydrorhamnose reductase